MTSSLQITSLPPLSLYVHIPWCVKKCPYCDFNSHAAGEGLPEQQYVAALIQDLYHDLEFAQGRPLQSIFFGGGTPSLFSPEAIGALLNHFDSLFEFTPNIEITLEANPGTVEEKKFLGFRAAGINRLSLGIQSFDNHLLRALGRIHSAEDAIAAVKAAKKAQFNSFNLDLMHGLPEQNQQQALKDLQQAIDLEPPHVSWYQLTIEPNTAFYSDPPSLPDDDTLAAIEDAGWELLADAGYSKYEVSAYCRDSYQSKHNVNYWQFGDYLGIGAGAHGKITAIDAHHIKRSNKTRLPQHYMNHFSGAMNPERIAVAIATEQKEADWKIVDPEQLTLEFMLNALRLSDGVPASHFPQRTGIALDTIAPQLNAARHRGLLVKDPDILRATPLGFKFLNDLLDYFMPQKVG